MTELSGNHIGVDPYIAQPAGRSETGGYSIEGLEHVIVDPDTGQPVPVGTEGEIWVRGYSLMQRLYKREREDVFTVDGYYRTGDCGVQYDDGWIRFTGRLGDLIKTGGGTNVTPSEVELALSNCDGVLEAYVVGVEDGDNGTVVGAAVVPAGTQHSTVANCASRFGDSCLRTRCPSSSGSRPAGSALHGVGQGQEVRSRRPAQQAARAPLVHQRMVVGHIGRHQRQRNHLGQLEYPSSRITIICVLTGLDWPGNA